MPNCQDASMHPICSAGHDGGYLFLTSIWETDSHHRVQHCMSQPTLQVEGGVCAVRGSGRGITACAQHYVGMYAVMWGTPAARCKALKIIEVVCLLAAHKLNRRGSMT
eukprot:356193-Chlamydomonas_euryale.AAC.3